MSSTQIPHTQTVVSYAYTVSANGTPLGTLQGFNPSANRPLERIRELQNEVDDTIEIVPGRTDFTISIDKFELYSGNAMMALTGNKDGTLDISTIITPFTITEQIKDPVKGTTRTVHYNNCWPTSLSKTIREGQITVMETVQLWVTSITVTQK